MLKISAAAGEIDLLYGDESGFCQWSEEGYSYYFQGEQKRQEQTKRRGKRLSIIGLWQPLVQFFYSLVIGSFKSEDFINLMEKQSKIASKSGRMRVIVIDNGSIHTSKIAKEKYSQWEEKGLFLFFLPPYCSEMNSIELEWQHLKRDQLAGQMFETEKELACHVIWGLEHRGEKGQYSVDFINLRPRYIAWFSFAYLLKYNYRTHLVSQETANRFNISRIKHKFTFCLELNNE